MQVFKKPTITETIRLNRLRWFGHVQRMEEIEFPKEYCMWGDPKKNKTSLNAAEHGGVGEGQRQCLFPRPSTVSSETAVFL